MKTITVSKAEMARRTARFGKLESYQQQHEREAGIPVAAFAQIAGRQILPVMAPASYAGRAAMAPVKGAEGLVITIAECPPGNGAGLHAHEQSVENFLCLSGRFEIAWGDDGKDSLILEPLDFISVPPRVSRSFKNVSNETARLLVIIQIQGKEQEDRVHYRPAVGDDIAKDFGRDTVEALSRIGFKFDAGVVS